MGCFEDKGDGRDLEIKLLDTGNAEKCYEEALKRDLRYIGLQDGS